MRPQTASLFTTLLCAWILSLPAPHTAAPQGDLSQNSNVTFFIYPTPTSGPVVNDPLALLPGRPVTLVLHGFKGDAAAKSVEAIRDALRLNGVGNVVLVDWSRLADAPDRTALTAYHAVRDTGVAPAAKEVAQWLRLSGVAPPLVHIIGFSLGGHMAGMVGNMLNSTVGRITGLDPPRFGYEKVDAAGRLDASDAVFVDVVHTGGTGISYTSPIGHSDWFPNGDTLPQPGCPKESAIHAITCSHYLAWVLYTESVFNPEAFIAAQCDKWSDYLEGQCSGTAIVGYHTPATTRGVFYSETAAGPPYGVEDPSNPLPSSLKALLVYDRTDTIVSASDVVNAVNPLKQRDLSSVEQLEESDSDNESKVMRVYSHPHPTTTPDPPAFLDSSSGAGPSHAHAHALALALLSLLLSRNMC